MESIIIYLESIYLLLEDAVESIYLLLEGAVSYLLFYFFYDPGEEELYIFYQCSPDFHWRKYIEARIIATQDAPYLLIPYYILPTGH